MTDADYADDLALSANTSALDESLLHSLEQAARGVSLYMNADKKKEFVLNTKEPSPLFMAIPWN